jgi:hypothetical protein
MKYLALHQSEPPKTWQTKLDFNRRGVMQCVGWAWPCGIEGYEQHKGQTLNTGVEVPMGPNASEIIWIENPNAKPESKPTAR